MKKVMSLLSLVVMLAIVFLATPGMAADAATAADGVVAQNDTAALVNVLIVALVPIVASLAANLTQKKEKDGPWVRLIKNTLNLFALNFSEKAGK